MAEAEQSAGSGHSSICLKHKVHWNNRFYRVLNELFGDDNVIPKKYQKRVGALVCTCDRRANLPVRCDPFNNVTSDDLINAVGYMDTFLITHNRHDKIDTFKKLMGWLRNDGLIPSDSADSQQSPEFIQRSSVHRLLYILQQCLLNNHTFLEPPPPVNNQNEPVPEQTLTFIVENCHHSLSGSIIGRNGSKVKPLLKMYKCHIKVDKVVQGDDTKIKVTVKKKTMSMETLNRVKQAIEDMAKEVVQDENRYKTHRQQEEIEHREDFKTLLQQTAGMGRNAVWNDILRQIIGNVRYFGLKRAMGYETLAKWFEELREECYPPEHEEQSSLIASSGRTFGGPGSSLTVHHNEFSDEEPEDTTLKGVTATAVTTSSNLAATTSGPVASTSDLRSNLNSQPRAEVSVMASNSSLSTNYLQPLSTAQEGRLSGGNRPSSLCLVHDRRWVPTYQFTLTKCFDEINLEKKYGRAFSRFVCCCQGSVPDILQHFETADSMKDAFKSALDKIKNWPMETEDIMQPLIRQLEKVQDGELWQSLYRFVFLFLKVLQGSTDYLKERFRLPYESSDSGEGIVVCQVDNTMPASQSSHSNVDASSIVCQVDTMSSSHSKVVTSKHVAKEDRNEDCYFHGKKNSSAFQCVVNYIHRNSGLPQKYHSSFCKSVCCCNEDSSSEPVYEEDLKLRADCLYMQGRLSSWRGDGIKNIKIYITLLDGFLEKKTPLGRGFQKVVYFFNCAYKKEYSKFAQG